MEVVTVVIWGNGWDGKKQKDGPGNEVNLDMDGVCILIEKEEIHVYWLNYITE